MITKKITAIQQKILFQLADVGRLFKPRRGLELLQKKGFVKGNKREGWTLSDRGFQWLAAVRW